MPTKTIYINENDLPLFQRAQHLAGGNLSAAVVQALRRFVEIREANVEGYQDVEVRVGTDGNYQRRRFVGRRVAYSQRPLGDGRTEYLTVYQTHKGRFALHTKRVDQRFAASDFAALPGEPGQHTGDNWQEYWENVTDLTEWGQPSGAELELAVFDGLAELQAAVPAELSRMAEANSHQQIVEELDI